MFAPIRAAAAVVTLTLSFQGMALAAASEAAQAEANRKKPLQRCDQLADKAQLECLHKARERIVEARNKREAAVQAAPAEKAGKPAPAGKSNATVAPGDK